MRPFAILVPFEEVRERGYPEPGDVVWRKPPEPAMCVEYDVLYTAAGLTVTGHPGADSMGTELVGRFDLANGEQVWVVASEHELGEETRQQAHQLRTARVTDADGNPIGNLGALAFGVEAGAIGMLLDVTLDSEEKSG